MANIWSTTGLQMLPDLLCASEHSALYRTGTALVQAHSLSAQRECYAVNVPQTAFVVKTLSRTGSVADIMSLDIKTSHWSQTGPA